MISAIILAKDCEDYIYDCIEQLKVPFISEIIVLVDEDSTDRTLQLARRQNVKVMSRKFSGSFAAERNFAQELAENDWCLHVDADERLPANFIAQLSDIIQKLEKLKKVALNLPRVNLPDCKNYPDLQMRLVKKSETKWIGKVHETVYSKSRHKRVDELKLSEAYEESILHLDKPAEVDEKIQERWKKMMRDVE